MRNNRPLDQTLPQDATGGEYGGLNEGQDADLQQQHKRVKRAVFDYLTKHTGRVKPRSQAGTDRQGKLFTDVDL